MKKMIIAVSCCSIMLIGGFAYAYSSHFKLSNNFLEKDRNYLDIIERSFGNSVANEKEEDKGKFLNGRKFLNGYYIAGKFNQVMGKNTKYEYVHKGIDIVAPRGTKILALANGVIKEELLPGGEGRGAGQVMPTQGRDAGQVMLTQGRR